MDLSAELERKARSDSLRRQIDTMLERKSDVSPPKPSPSSSMNEAVHRRMTEFDSTKDK